MTCGQKEASCVCVEPPGHTTPHVCDCGGSWKWDEGQMVIVAWPGGRPFDGPASMFLEILDRLDAMASL